MIITYTGPLDEHAQRIQELYAAFPDHDFEPFTCYSMEVLPNDGFIEGDVVLGVWKVSKVTYAEINPPGISLEGLADRIAELKKKHGHEGS